MPNDPRKPPQSPSHDKAWQPKVDPERALHSFANVGPDAGASPTDPPPQLRDANEDTAPLQGSNDRSDEDSLLDTSAEDRGEDAALADDQRRRSQSGGAQRPDPSGRSEPRR